MSIERWDIDSDQSRIEFAVRHLVFSKTRGRFARWRGTVLAPNGDFTRGMVDVVIDASSINTGIARRDAHLRSADFLDVERYPNITFSSRRVSAEREGRLRVVGALTIKNVMRDVSFDVVPAEVTRDSGGSERAVFSATPDIDRRDFGFTGNLALDAGGLVIGDRIEVEIEVEAVRRSSVRAA